jgi:type VI secretion system protein ImpH
VPLKKPLTMSVSQPVTLTNRPVMGNYATDVNSQVLMRLTTTDPELKCRAGYRAGSFTRT